MEGEFGQNRFGLIHTDNVANLDRTRRKGCVGQNSLEVMRLTHALLVFCGVIKSSKLKTLEGIL